MASEFARFKCSQLIFRVSKPMSVESARALAQFKGASIILQGVKQDEKMIYEAMDAYAGELKVW